MEPSSILQEQPSSHMNDLETPVLEHIVVVCRLSDHHNDERGKITNLKARAYELADFAESFVTDKSSNVTKTAIVLNGVSSNINTSEHALSAGKLADLRAALQQGTALSNGYTLLVVSTIDGLWTNVYSFARFFAPFTKSRLSYMVYGANNSFILRIQALLHAAYALLDPNDLSSSADPQAVDFIKRIITISYGKIYQREGNLVVRSQLSGLQRNVIAIASPSNPYNFDPAIRVVRVVRVGGPDQQPQFAYAEEKRWKVKLMNGGLACPTASCRQMLKTLDELVVHLISQILQEAIPKCPLCPHELAAWNFHSVVAGICHLLRHLSPSTDYTEQDKRKVQCPLCLKLMASISVVLDHVLDVHVLALEVRTAAMLVGVASIDGIKSIEDYMRSSAKQQDLADLQTFPEAYHQLRDLVDSASKIFQWTTATHIDPQNPPCLLTPLPELESVTSMTDRVQAVSSTSNAGTSHSQTKWYNPYIVPKNDATGNQLRRNTLQVEIQHNEAKEMLCPLSLELCNCGQYFSNTSALSKHICEVLKHLEPGKQVCPWCPSPKNAEIIFKAPGKYNANDLRHLQRHFPKDVSCRFCQHKSATVVDMITHVNSVHLKFACQVDGCNARFETQIALSSHNSEHEP